MTLVVELAEDTGFSFGGSAVALFSCRRTASCQGLRDLRYAVG
jgi:hypothetical protein